MTLSNCEIVKSSHSDDMEIMLKAYTKIDKSPAKFSTWMKSKRNMALKYIHSRIPQHVSHHSIANARAVLPALPKKARIASVLH